MAKPLGRKRPKTHQRVAAALRYYRNEETWTHEKLVDKAGRLAIRLLAADQVFRERTGSGILSRSVRQALDQMVVRHDPTS